MPCSGTRTPYPQKHQQTLGATLPALWKTTSRLHISGHTGVFSGVYAIIDHILIVSSKAFVYKALSRQRTSYPQKRQQTLGASLCLASNLSRKKPSKNRQLAWLFFVQRAAGLGFKGLWTVANRLSTGGSTGIVGNAVLLQTESDASDIHIFLGAVDSRPSSIRSG